MLKRLYKKPFAFEVMDKFYFKEHLKKSFFSFM